MRATLLMALACGAALMCVLPLVLLAVEVSLGCGVRYRRGLASWVTRLLGAQACLAFCSGPLVWVLGGGVPAFTFTVGSWQPALRLDGLAWLMLSIVTFVGWTVSRFAERYLDGERKQSAFFRWTMLTVASVSLMVLAGDYWLLVGGWVFSSFGMHWLLMYHAERPAARRAAWTKFAISRFGDVALLVAAGLAWSLFQSWDLELWRSALSDPESTLLQSGTYQGFCIALALGAVIKTAQFPFHVWLPETLEVPTPVSALMHAGVVNAGGFVLIRFAPFLSLSHVAMWLCVAFGLLTAAYGVVVMRSQHSIKRTLAYSTVAQMGFMVLQCGLGAFSAAGLHLVAHSLYKAYAFLASGQLIDTTAVEVAERDANSVSRGQWLVACGFVFGLFLVVLAGLGMPPWEKPGGLVLGSVLCLSLASFVAPALSNSKSPLRGRTLMAAGAMVVSYAVAYRGVDWVIAGALEPGLGPAVLRWQMQLGLLAGVIASVALVGWAARRWAGLGEQCYAMVVNGFYVEVLARRCGRLVHRMFGRRMNMEMPAARQ